MKSILRKLHISSEAPATPNGSGESSTGRGEASPPEHRKHWWHGGSHHRRSRSDSKLDDQTHQTNQDQGKQAGHNQLRTQSTGAKLGALTRGPSTEDLEDSNLMSEDEEFQLALAMSLSATEEQQGGSDDHELEAAKRLSLLSASKQKGSRPTPEGISYRYWVSNALDYKDTIEDGFYDISGMTSTNVPGGRLPPLRWLHGISPDAYPQLEVILVDRSQDAALIGLEAEAIDIVNEVGKGRLGVDRLANLVSSTMGGPVASDTEMMRAWQQSSLTARHASGSIVLPLGCYRNGLCRHRALLFKVLADAVGIRSKLERGRYHTGIDEAASNTVLCEDGREYTLDLMSEPGLLIPPDSPDRLYTAPILPTSSPPSTHPLASKSHVNPPLFANSPTAPQLGAYSTLTPPHYAHPPATPHSGTYSSLTPPFVAHSPSTPQLGRHSSLNIPHYAHSPTTPQLGAHHSLHPLHYAHSPTTPQLGAHSSLNPPLHAHSPATPPLEAHSFAMPPNVDSPVTPPQHRSPYDSLIEEQPRKPLIGNGLKRRSGSIPCELDLTPSKEKPRNERSEPETLEVPFVRRRSPSWTEGLGSPALPQLVMEMVQDNPRFARRLQGELAGALDAAINRQHPPNFPPPSATPPQEVPPPDPKPRLSRLSVHGYPGVSEVTQRKLLVTEGSQTSDSPRWTAELAPAGRTSSAPLQTETSKVDFTALRPTFSDATLLLAGGAKGGEVLRPGRDGGSQAGSTGRVKVDDELADIGTWEIKWEDLKLGERIGLGSYGEVYRGDWRGSEVAVKKFLGQELEEHALQEFQCEVSIMRRLRHPNVVLFMGAVIKPPNLSIVTEFLHRGSLYRLLHKAGSSQAMDERRRLRMALDIAKGMNYLHQQEPVVVHRDLKSPNLLVDKNWVVKVCDFGLSRMKHSTFLSSKSTAGTPEWMAPEILRNEPSDEKCDVYSFGVILWELCTLQVPWSGMNAMQVVGAVGFQDRRLDIPADVDPPLADLIEACWRGVPQERPSFADIMAALKPLQKAGVDRRNSGVEAVNDSSKPVTPPPRVLSGGALASGLPPAHPTKVGHTEGILLGQASAWKTDTASRERSREAVAEEVD